MNIDVSLSGSQLTKMKFKNASDFTKPFSGNNFANMFKPSDDKCYVSENVEISIDPDICSECSHMDLSDVRDDTCRTKYCEVMNNDISSRFKRYSCSPVITKNNQISTVCTRCNRRMFTVRKTPEELEEDERLRLQKESNMRTRLQEHDRIMEKLRRQSMLSASSNFAIQRHFELPSQNVINSNHSHTHGHTHGHTHTNGGGSNSGSTSSGSGAIFTPNFDGATPVSMMFKTINSKNKNLDGSLINDMDQAFGHNENNTRRDEILSKAAGSMDFR